jgi:hypothetical protein
MSAQKALFNYVLNGILFFLFNPEVVDEKH